MLKIERATTPLYQLPAICDYLPITFAAIDATLTVEIASLYNLRFIKSFARLDGVDKA